MKSAGNWTSERVDSTSYVGALSLAIDAQNRLHVAFDRGSNDYDCNIAYATTAVTAVTPGGPRETTLAVYPNPWRGESLTISYRIGVAEESVDLRVYDPAGRRVRTIYAGSADGAPQDARWDGSDDAGGRVAPGIYFVRLATAAGERTQRVAVLR